MPYTSSAIQPRLVIAGLSGGSGKTLVSLGLVRAFARQGLSVAPFKKGPDYIDAKWLSLAAGRPAVNLDAFLMDQTVVAGRFAEAAAGHDIAVIEGNRGVFDGLDEQGSQSTATLAKLLAAPVVLTLDATKMTRTAAAIVAGVNGFEPDFRLAGVVLNRTAGPRHRSLLRGCISSVGVPVLGTLPKLAANPIPERHMGLMSDQEMEGVVDAALDSLAEMIAEHLDLEAVLTLARDAGPLPDAPWPAWPARVAVGCRPRIGVVRDAALWFYYPENLLALERAGAELVELSILSAEPWPELHGLYLGGGFPETHAPQLSANRVIREHVRALAYSGLPIYAECGGFMYLADAFEAPDGPLPMAGVLPVSTRLCDRPQGLGYVEATVEAANPYHPTGARLRGHEFHYSRCVSGLPPGMVTALRLDRGTGMAGGQDGIVAGPADNVFAAYSHIHALGAAHWAPNFVKAAAAFALGGSASTRKE